jgi:hypothetical protein
MTDSIGFIVKVMVLSAVIATAIKQVGPQLQIPTTATSAMIGVTLPALIMGVVLSWRTWNYRSNTSSKS